MKESSVKQAFTVTLVLCVTALVILVGLGIFTNNFTYFVFLAVPVAVTLACGIFYLIVAIRRRGGCHTCCRRCGCSCCPESVNSRCVRCLEKSLCLHVPPETRPPPWVPTALASEMVRQPYDNASVSTDTTLASILGTNNYNVVINGSGNTTVIAAGAIASTPSGGSSACGDASVSTSVAASPYHQVQNDHLDEASQYSFKRSQLRQLETDMNRLFQIHSELESHIASADEGLDLVPLDRLVFDSHSLQHEAKKIRIWIEGSGRASSSPTTPSQEDLDTTGNRMRRIRRHFNVYRRQLGLAPDRVTGRLSSSGRPRRPHSRSQRRSVSSDLSLPSPSVCSVGIQLPPYSVSDPLQGLDPLEGQTLSEHHASDVSLSSANQRQLSVSLHSLAPPPVDINAPPSYEEATSSQV